MSMASLLAWRTTCRDNFFTATVELRQSQSRLVARFFPSPKVLLRYLTRWGALIVGEAAASLVLHNPLLCHTTLEIAVGCLVFDPFIRCFAHFVPFGTHLISRTDAPAPPMFPALRHISRIAEFKLKSGLSIQVYESTTPSPCDVVCGSWTTALMNFVTESSFGCAYPRLTLNNKGVLCDERVGFTRWLDQTTHDRLRANGMTFSFYSPKWTEYSAGPYTSSSPSMTACGRTMYVCPSQARFFGDSGSLIVFLDGFLVNLDKLRSCCIAPYGTMTAWRISSKLTCEGRCIEDKSVVPPYVHTILIHFQDRPTSSPYDEYASPNTSSMTPSRSQLSFYRRHSF